MIDNECFILERDESRVIDDKDIIYINTNHRKEFEFWLREKDD